MRKLAASALLGLALVSCSSRETGDVSHGRGPSGEGPGVAPLAGGHTSDFGDKPVCVLTGHEEISPQRAEELGLVLEPYLGLLRQSHSARLRWRQAACDTSTGPDSEVSIDVAVEPLQIFHDTYTPDNERVSCPEALSFVAPVHLRVDDDLLEGRFMALFETRPEGSFEGDSERLCVREYPDLSYFRGSFATTLARQRPHWAKLAVDFCLGAQDSSGSLFTSIRYTDQGSPATEPEYGGDWQRTPPEADREDGGSPEPARAACEGLVTLDAYRGSAKPPSARITVRADAVEPAVPLEVVIRVNGRATRHSSVDPGSEIELGALTQGTRVEVEARNANGAKQVTANILADDYFRASVRCREPDCVARAEYVVAWEEYRD